MIRKGRLTVVSLGDTITKSFSDPEAEKSLVRDKQRRASRRLVPGFCREDDQNKTTQDYLDVMALADYMGDDNAVRAMCPFDRLYLQDSGESALQRLQVQLASALPYDLEETELSEYKNLDPLYGCLGPACNRHFRPGVQYGGRLF